MIAHYMCFETVLIDISELRFGCWTFILILIKDNKCIKANILNMAVGLSFVWKFTFLYTQYANEKL